MQNTSTGNCLGHTNKNQNRTNNPD